MFIYKINFRYIYNVKKYLYFNIKFLVKANLIK